MASAPTPTGTVTWTDDAFYLASSSTAETVWLVGFLRVLKTATYTFSLDTNGDAALFLSTDDNPANKVLLATATSTQSTPVSINNNTK